MGTTSTPPPRRVRAALALLLAAAALVGAPSPAQAAPNRLELSGMPAAPWGYDPGSPGAGRFASGRWTTDSLGGGLATHRLDFPNGEWHAMVSRARGWAVEARVRVDPLTRGEGCTRTNVWAHDATNLVHFGFGRGAVCVLYPVLVTVPATTADRFHTYRFAVRGDVLTIAVDGVQRARISVPAVGGGSQLLGFGDFGAGASGGRQVLHWDWFAYDVSIGGPRCTIVGTALADSLVGTAGADNICAGRGDDVVRGGGGADQLVGFLGRDRLVGEGGDDRLYGGDGDDALVGGAGTDACFGGAGTDTATACERRTEVP